MQIRRFLGQLGKELRDDDLPDVAAMLAYYAVIALFPMVVFVASLALLVIDPGTVHQGVQMATEATPPAVRELIEARVMALMHANHAGFAAGGLALALWGASRGAVALGTALDEVYDKHETRSWLRRQLTAIIVTVVVALIAVIALGLLVVGPTIGHWIADRFGLGGAFDTVWGIARWIGAGVLVMLVWAIAYRFLPDTDAPFHVFTPGAFIGVVAWLGASALFALYLDHFGSYETTYGALGTAIIFLLWLWISNLALLLGAEIDGVLADVRNEHSDAAAQLSNEHARAT